MEKYQRNIFGFAFKVQIFSFEYIVTIMLTFISLLLIFGYISTKILEIEQRKLDVLRSTTIFEDYDKLGKLNILKDSNLMPVVDIKVNSVANVKKYDVFKKINERDMYWDQRHEVDIEKLNRFINIVIIVNNKLDGKSRYI